MTQKKMLPRPCLHQKHHQRWFHQTLQTHQDPHQEHLLQLLARMPHAQPDVVKSEPQRATHKWKEVVAIKSRAWIGTCDV